MLKKRKYLIGKMAVAAKTVWYGGTTSKACWIWTLQYDGVQRGRKANTFRRKYKAKTIDALVEDTPKMANQGAFLQGVCVSTYAD
jgi:hypothetical protein